MLKTLSRLFRRVPPPAPLVIPAAQARALTPEQRQELRDWLRHPTTQLALALLEARHPGTRVAPGLTVAKDANDAYGAVYFLNRVRGWEAYRNALLSLAEPPPSAAPLEETYPYPGE